MPRVISKKPNTLRLHDNLSDSTLELYYRTPTAKEQAGYTNGMTKRQRNKVVNCTGENRQKYGKDILTGFRDGDFVIEKDDGSLAQVSSNPGSDGYREDWKKWFCKHNADLVEVLAVNVFERPADTDEGEELPDTTEDDQDITDPS